MPSEITNPAEQAALRALDQVYAAIDAGRSFRLEAGAGAGKTYSLVKALKHLIDKQGPTLLKQHRQVACITYTNVATDEIRSRIDSHPAVFVSTIHSFCWSLIKDFQPQLRNRMAQIEKWSEKLTAAGGVGNRKVTYDEFGHRSVDEHTLSLHHDDVLDLTVYLMSFEKFGRLVSQRYPYLFIDEYQDTNGEVAEALRTHFFDSGVGPLVGLFGDHWQKIYGEGCGKLEHPTLEPINKNANFRSVPAIVTVLNRMRPELPQDVKDPSAIGTVAVYHTNTWSGVRRSGSHWAGDLPADEVDHTVSQLMNVLETQGWDFSTPDVTKILMLTHNALADKQGYRKLADVFRYNDSFIKKHDPHIAFFVDILEPVCTAYEKKRFGEMFALLGSRTPLISTHADKRGWATDMDSLLRIRASGTVGDVIAHLRETKRPRLPETLEARAKQLEEINPNSESEISLSLSQAQALRDVPYQEVIALKRFLDGHSPFETKHGVKGAEFENVLVVFGRGWNVYNFGQFLDWSRDISQVPPNKVESYESNRNLFYVVCSRPKRNLALLFTQKLSQPALDTLAAWFGDESIHSAFDEPVPAND